MARGARAEASPFTGVVGSPSKAGPLNIESVRRELALAAQQQAREDNKDDSVLTFGNRGGFGRRERRGAHSVAARGRARSGPSLR